jgi:hypothetical protein
MPSRDNHRQTLQPHDSVSNERKVHTTILTQNIQGLWHRPRVPEGNILLDQPPDTSKMEYNIYFMRNNNAGAWLEQETWEEDNEFEMDIGGYHIFCHNSMKGKDGGWHLFKGVDIFLSPQFYAVWQEAGSPLPITIPNEDFAERFIQLSIKFNTFNSRGKRIKGKALTIALILAYSPCDDVKHEQYCASFDSMLNSINSNTTIVVGSDINAWIGIMNCPEHACVIGPHDIERSNSCGENLLHILGMHQICVKNTFFWHDPDEYATYSSIPTNLYPQGIPSMHGIFICSQLLHKRVRDCNTILEVEGVSSDHWAISWKLRLTSTKVQCWAISKGDTNWCRILSDEMMMSTMLQY